MSPWLTFERNGFKAVTRIPGRRSKVLGSHAPILVAGLMAGFLALSNVQAVDLLVSNTNDSGSGSLRRAISDNNTLGGTNRIIFSNVVTGTITLTNGELLISGNVAILGPGPGLLAVNGNAAGRIFDIGSGATVTIAGLAVTNGSFPRGSGGGIFNYHATLTVSNCTLSGNSARNGGAIYHTGLSGRDLSVLASTLAGNSATYGGAIYNDGSSSGSAVLGVSASLIRSNSATFGGGAIYNAGRSSGNAFASVNTSTLDGNVASSDQLLGGGYGGAIYNDGNNSGIATISVFASTFSSNSALSGGAIYNDGSQGGDARVNATVSTFSGNSVNYGGGAISTFGPQGNAELLVCGCTFSGNSAAGGDTIYNESGALIIGDTILNAGRSGTNLVSFNGGFSTQGYNLSSDNGSGFLIAPTDRLNIAPMLGPLRDNGGPTFTHALLPGSPAIDQGKTDAVPFMGTTDDQRGAPRSYGFSSVTNMSGGDGSDIGAFELGSPQLGIQLHGNTVVLSWPSYYGDFTLYSSTNVASSNSWIAAAGLPVVLGNQYQQTNAPVSGDQFFRLRNN